MRLIRNQTKNQQGKYAVVRLEKMPDDPSRRCDVEYALRILFENSLLTYGHPNTKDEFFVMFLRDSYALPALKAYANSAEADGATDYADDVCDLAARSGRFSAFHKRPD